MSEQAPPEASGRTPIWKNPFAIAFVVGAITLTVLPFLQETQYRAPEPISQLGKWQLVDQWGKPLGDEQMLGKVWIASFFFTRCPSVCPKEQADFITILKHVDDLQQPIELVSISVDPEHDTPEVLNAYARKLAASNSPSPKWHLLTGSHDALKDIVIKRFLVDMGDKKAIEGSADLFDISHSMKLALIDQTGALRGFWSSDDQGRGNIINAARLLAKRGPNP